MLSSTLWPGRAVCLIEEIKTNRWMSTEENASRIARQGRYELWARDCEWINADSLGCWTLKGNAWQVRELWGKMVAILKPHFVLLDAFSIWKTCALASESLFPLRIHLINTHEQVTHARHLDHYQSSGCSVLHQLSIPSACLRRIYGNLLPLLPSNTTHLLFLWIIFRLQANVTSNLW